MTGRTVRPLRWGILGAARIAAKSLIPAIRASGGEVVAVGASSRERAEQFGRENRIPRTYRGYHGVLDDTQVEAVYIPLANGLHKEWALRTAAARKPCLCEKPMALTASDAAELRAAFRKSGVLLFEAFMWRHHPQMDWLRRQLGQGVIGEIRQIKANFSFTLDRPDDYRWRADQGGGALWDIGCYCVNAARQFFGAEPKAVSARSCFRSDRVDESTAGWLDFDHGRHAIFACSLASAFSQSLEIIGSDGRAWVAMPWLQLGKSTRILIECGEERTVQEIEAANAYIEMLRHFTRAALDSSFSPAPAEDGWGQAQVMESLVKSSQAGGAVQTI